MSRPRTLGNLKVSGYRPRSVRDELRENMIGRLRSGEKLFPGIVGFEHTVEPQVVNAILSRHDFILLGLRGQAKTRLLRSLVQFLDEWVPAIEGCPLNSDPFRPLTHHAKALLDAHGDDAPIAWLHRDQRARRHGLPRDDRDARRPHGNPAVHLRSRPQDRKSVV